MNDSQTPNVRDIYTNNVKHFDTLVQETSKRYDFVSWARLAAIILGGIFIYLMGKLNVIMLIFAFIIVIAIFLKLVLYHVSLGQHKSYLERLEKINSDELKYLTGQFASHQKGDHYLDEAHSYAVDLDIFGDRSIFHFINRTQTKIGEAALAKALTMPASIEEIKWRQEASQELSSNLDWRQDFLASVDATEDDLDHLLNIQNWLEEPDKLSIHKWLNWGRFFIPILTISLTAIVLAGNFPISMLIFIILIPGVILAKYNSAISDIQNHTEKSQQRIAHYAQLIAKVEKRTFETEKLTNLQHKFNSNDQQSASQAIDQLGYFIRQLNVRNNPFALVLNIFGFWDFHWALALEKWKHQYKGDVKNWFKALGEFDFLISLANLKYNYPDWINANIDDHHSSFSASDLKHPLIFSHAAVGNEINIDLHQKVMLITGSNMAGKSTFLRSVGVNLVLAYAGAVVNAQKLSAPTLRIFTSMRTRDNLHESTSSFYAELKRLQSAMRGVESKPNSFVLFDEILKGTNSVDRHTGAKAIIQQIIQNKSAGIVATHDLDLAKMESETNRQVENWCFDVEIKNGKLDFDYLIKRGVCSSFNATFLMKEMGFNVDINQSAKK